VRKPVAAVPELPHRVANEDGQLSIVIYDRDPHYAPRLPSSAASTAADRYRQIHQNNNVFFSRQCAGSNVLHACTRDAAIAGPDAEMDFPAHIEARGSDGLKTSGTGNGRGERHNGGERRSIDEAIARHPRPRKGRDDPLRLRAALSRRTGERLS